MRRFLLLFALAATVAALAAVPAAAHPRDFTVIGVHTHTTQKPSGAFSFREKLCGTTRESGTPVSTAGPTRLTGWTARAPSSSTTAPSRPRR